MAILVVILTAADKHDRNLYLTSGYHYFHFYFLLFTSNMCLLVTHWSTPRTTAVSKNICRQTAGQTGWLLMKN